MKRVTVSIMLFIGLICGAVIAKAERITTFNYHLSKVANEPVGVYLWGNWNGSSGIIINSEAVITLDPGQTMVSQTVDLDEWQLLRGDPIGNTLQYQIEIRETPSDFYCGWSSDVPADTIHLGSSIIDIDVNLDEIYCSDRRTLQSVQGSELMDYFMRLGDINRDGYIDAADVGLMIMAWGSANFDDADLNGDGIINIVDFGNLASNWGRRRPF